MIPLYKKLHQENLIKPNGAILDLGSGDGSLSLPFFKNGSSITLVDINKDALVEAQNKFQEIKSDGLETINSPIENFQYSKNYDGIIISNVLPFITNTEQITKVTSEAFTHLNQSGFLYFTLFGEKDQWKMERDNMSFHSKDEVFKILDQKPYFVSEDFGKGATKSGAIKTWHVYSFLYIK